MAEPPENGVWMVVFLTEVDFRTNDIMDNIGTQFEGKMSLVLQNLRR